MKTIYYKNWLGEWVKSEMTPTKKNLEYIRKHWAENGRAEIFGK